MKNRKTLKKLILGSLFLLGTSSLFAQTQKVKTLQAKNSSSSTTMNSDAIIQMDSDNKGLLLPRIALTGANKVAPLTAHTAGMVIYNTATVTASGTGASVIEAVTPGYYYNNGTKWVKIANTDGTDITNDAWKNNTTTNVVELGTKADGTTTRDAGTEVVIKDDGNVGIGTIIPEAKLDINGYVKLGSADAIGDTVPKPGMLRYNITTNKFQGYVGGTTNAWVDLN